MASPRRCAANSSVSCWVYALYASFASRSSSYGDSYMASFLTCSPSCTAASRARAAPEEWPKTNADPPAWVIRASRSSTSLDRIGHCVPTFPAATPVVGEHAEVRRKARRQGGPAGTCGQGTSYQDERGSLTRLIEGDGSAVFGNDGAHGVSSRVDQLLVLFCI